MFSFHIFSCFHIIFNSFVSFVLNLYTYIYIYIYCICLVFHGAITYSYYHVACLCHDFGLLYNVLLYVLLYLL